MKYLNNIIDSDDGKDEKEAYKVEMLRACCLCPNVQGTLSIVSSERGLHVYARPSQVIVKDGETNYRININEHLNDTRIVRQVEVFLNRRRYLPVGNGIYRTLHIAGQQDLYLWRLDADRSYFYEAEKLEEAAY